MEDVFALLDQKKSKRSSGVTHWRVCESLTLLGVFLQNGDVNEPGPGWLVELPDS